MLQLELDLKLQIEVAEQDPEESPVKALLPSLDLIWELEGLSPRHQLEIAGDAFVQISEFYGLRADVLLDGWQDAFNQEGPVYDIDDGLVRRYMDCDDGLVTEREVTTRRTVAKADEFFTVVENEDTLLRELGMEERETEPEQVLSVIEEESVSDWMDAIAQQLDKSGGKVSLQKLKKALGLSYGRLWLGLLLGGFRLESSCDRFYGDRITVLGC